VSQNPERIAGIVIADATSPGFPMIYVSPGFEELTGYRAEEVLGRSCSMLQGPQTDPRSVDVLRQAVREGREAYATLINYRKDGTPFWNEVALAAQRDETGRVVRYLGVQKDVSDRLQAQARMRELAYTDALTGLANRAAVTERLAEALADAQAHTHPLGLLFVDIDDFKKVNDSLGHVAGDRALAAVAERLRAVVPSGATLARPGGDEFLVLIDKLASEDAAHDLASRLLDCLREPVGLGEGRTIRIRASVGVSTYPRDASTVEDLLGHADVAMYIAKGAGKNRFHVYHKQSRRTGERPDPGFDPGAELDELDRILAGELITAVFQPLVDIAAGTTIGYEALARGPEGSNLSRPDRLFATAVAAGRVAELDWTCRAAAVRAALAAGLGSDVALFVNCEPSAVDAPCPDRYADLWTHAQRELQIVLEITERAVTDRPAELCRLVREHRAAGVGIALDDLGADVRSLALLPFIEPDVIKLDLRLVQDRPSTEQAAIVSAVAAERERTGAAVVAEGIETDAHLAVARSLGANLGQGYLWGRPGPLPAPARRSGAWRRPIVVDSRRPGRTPYEVVAGDHPMGEATKRLLLPMSHHLENRALRIGEGAVLVAAFQDARHFTPRTAVRYEMLARGASLVAALGVGLSDEPVENVRGAHIAPDDPLAGEWSVVVVGPHFAGALVAQDLGDGGRESDRRFLFSTTYRRDLVIAAARTLLERVVPVSAANSLLIPS
jgi:diguanylate cyclase (GGDEF)-like protein/PAS domain S-box-containing protein